MSTKPVAPALLTSPHLGVVLFESSPDCVKLLDLDGRLQEMNHNGQCLMEVDDVAGVCGQEWSSLWPPESHDHIRESLAAARRGSAGRFQAFCPTAKGTPKWWDVTVNPITDREGRPIGILSVSRDITELEYARRAQHEAAESLRFILASSQIGTWQLDLETGATSTSLLHDRCFGYDEPVTDWSYERFMAHVHPDDAAAVEAAFARVRPHGEDLAFECRVRWGDGSEHWIAVRGNALAGTRRMLGSVVDITQRKGDERALVESRKRAVESAAEAEAGRARLDALLDAAPVAIMYVGPDGQLVSANAATRDLWGEYPTPRGVDEYVEWKGWWADGSERHGQRVETYDWPIGRLLAGRESGVTHDIVEIEPFDAPGTRRTTLLQADLVRDGDGVVIGGVLIQIDITEQVRAEAALRESEARFRTITNAVPQMIWSTLPDGSSDYFSRQWYEFTGTEVGDCDGFRWVELVSPEDRAVADAEWRHCSALGIPYEIEYRLRHHADGYRWVLARGVPVRDEAGRIERWMGTCTDVHERKMFESALERSEDALRQADRRKDEFLAMLAHELRNPLAPISTAAHLLQKASHDETRVRHASQIIARQVRHMTELVDDLLDVSRVTRGLVELQSEPLDLKSVVGAALEQARPLFESRGHVVRTWTGAAAVPVNGDRTRLVQVVANLLNNAAKYTPQGGEIELRVDVSRSEARLVVTDNGVGVDGELLPGIFELFTQGKRTPDRSQGGLGIGLALVRSIVALHGGHVSAASPGPGQGSTFTVALPLAVAAADPPPPERSAARHARSLRVLVVDDNIDAAEMLGEMLELEGHAPVVATDPREALGLVQAGAAFDAYVLDIGLPGMSGYDLATRLRDSSPDRRAVFIALTGYGQAHDRQLSHAAGFDHHMVKPVRAACLLDLLEQTLGGSATSNRGRTAIALDTVER